MSGITVKLKADHVSFAKFNAMLDTVIANSSRSLPELLAQVGKILAGYAYRSTPIFPHKTVVSPPALKKISGKNDFEVDQNAKPQTYKVYGRGFARSGWARAMQELGARASAYGIPAAKYGGVEASKSKENASLLIHNDVPYIEDLNNGSRWNQPQNIMTKALNAARKDMERQLIRAGKKILKEAGIKA
jgi:hypothetical protein